MYLKNPVYLTIFDFDFINIAKSLVILPDSTVSTHTFQVFQQNSIDQSLLSNLPLK